MQDLASFLPLVGIALLFWLLIIRPASKRQKAMVQMQSSLEVGAEIVLTSGIFATVAAAEDDHLLVSVADGVLLKVARGAVGQILPPQHEEIAAESAEADPTDPTDPRDN